MKDFKDKNVYIVGGSSGIGFSTAKLLFRKGSHIILFARNTERLQKAVNEIEGLRIFDDQKLSWMAMDVANREEVKSIFKNSINDFGPPDLLINCAGRAIPYRFEDITYEQLNETMKINLYGTWNTVEQAVPFMKEKGGHIVNVSSIAGFIGVYGLTDYCASKFAVIGFSEALRSELKPFVISVSVLCPPDTDTPGFEVENRTKPEETKAISSSAKLLQPDRVAKTLIKGIQKGKFLIIPGFNGKLSYYVKRLFPSLVTAIMDWDIRRVQLKGSR